MGLKSYEHFHLNTSDGQKDAWHTIVPILHTSGYSANPRVVQFHYIIPFTYVLHCEILVLNNEIPMQGGNYVRLNNCMMCSSVWGDNLEL